jgi:hypothetical protein
MYLPETIRPAGFKGNLRRIDGEKKSSPLLDFSKWMPFSAGRMVKHDMILQDKVVEMVQAVAPPPPPPPPPSTRISRQMAYDEKEEDHRLKSNTGFGGSGKRKRIDGVIGSPEGLEEQALQPVFQGEVSHLTEAGQLSIPVTVSYDGKPYSFRTLLLKKGETPSIAYFYLRHPSRQPVFFTIAVWVLILTGGGFLTLLLWQGWNGKVFLWGVLAPFAVSHGVSWLTAGFINPGALFIVPVAFFAYQATRVILEIFFKWIRQTVKKAGKLTGIGNRKSTVNGNNDDLEITDVKSEELVNQDGEIVPGEGK